MRAGLSYLGVEFFFVFEDRLHLEKKNDIPSSHYSLIEKYCNYYTTGV